MKKLLRDKNFLKSLITIAVPITVQNFFSTALNFVDNLMIGNLGKEAISAVGQANKLFFFFVLILFGIYSGVGVFSAQFWGKKDVYNIKRILGLSLIAGCSVSILFTLAAVIFPQSVMAIFSGDPQVRSIGADYLRIVGVSYLFMSITLAYGMVVRSMGLVKIPMIASVVSLGLNTGLNFVLIFGMLGFSPMGVKGAAIATLTSRIVELGIMMYFVYVRKGGTVIANKPLEMFNLSFDFVGNVFKTAFPVIVNEFFWSLGMTVYAVVYGWINTDAVAAVEISNTIVNLFMIIGRSIASASAVMIGNKIGDEKFDDAQNYAGVLSKLGVYLGIIMGVVLIIIGPLFVNMYNVSDSIKSDSLNILYVLAGISFVKILNGILVVGVFRSGGDTLFSMILDSGSVWIIGIPMAVIGAFFLKLPIFIVLGMVQLEEVVKALIGLRRMKSRKWIRNVVNDI